MLRAPRAFSPSALNSSKKRPPSCTLPFELAAVIGSVNSVATATYISSTAPLSALQRYVITCKISGSTVSVNLGVDRDRERVLAQADLEEHAIRDADRAALRAPVEHHAALAVTVEVREADALDVLLSMLSIACVRRMSRCVARCVFRNAKSAVEQ